LGSWVAAQVICRAETIDTLTNLGVDTQQPTNTATDKTAGRFH
jgi:hypothetical protein